MSLSFLSPAQAKFSRPLARTAGASTILSAAAAGMSSGETLSLTGGNLPGGLNLFTHQAGSAGVSGYTTKIARDVAGKRMFHIGSDHGVSQFFVVFSEENHEWTLQTETPFAAATKHGYEHTTYDELNGKLYHRPYAAQSLYRWDGGGTWTEFSHTSIVNYSTSRGCIEWFPEMSRIICTQNNGSGTNGICFGFNPASGTFESYESGGVLSAFGEGEYWARYSQQGACVVFGSSASGNIYKINSSGVVSLISDNRPGDVSGIGPGGEGSALPFINPSNGNLVVIDTSSIWYDYNISTGTWSAKGGSAPAMSGRSDPFAITSCTLFEYGVVSFVRGDQPGSSDATMYLWKP